MSTKGASTAQQHLVDSKKSKKDEKDEKDEKG